MTKLKNSNLGFRICFDIRYSYFEFKEGIGNYPLTHRVMFLLNLADTPR